MFTCDHCRKETVDGPSCYHEPGCHLCPACDKALAWEEVKRGEKR